MLSVKLTSAPRWMVYGLIALALLAAWGWIGPWLHGPDLSTVTVARNVPVPVKVPEVKWLQGKATVERVEVPVEVIKEVPARQAAEIAEKFDLKLPEMAAKGQRLIDVRQVPKAPYGGEMALTIDTGTGKVGSIFRPNEQPFFQLGGMREVGVDYDAVNGTGIGYYRQDLLRAGPAVLNGKVYGSVPLNIGGTALRPTTGANFGATIGVAIRF